MAETPLEYHRPLVPLGLAYLGAILEDAFTQGRWEEYVRGRIAGTQPKGYKSSGYVAAQDNMLLSFYGRYSFDALLKRIREHAGDCPPDQLYVGMSVLSDGMHSARKMLRYFRLQFPLAKIIVGGPHATFFPYDFYEYPETREGPLADYVVKNEGELAILGIIGDLLHDRSSLESNARRLGINLAGCDYSDSEYCVIDGGQYRGGEDSVGLRALDDLPTPAYFLFEDTSGRLPYEPDRRYGLEAPAANINSSRGCPHKCTFCTIPKLAPGYRTLSPQRMVEITRFLAEEYGIRSVFFREDNFLYAGGILEGDRWNDVEEFCRRLSEYKLGVRWAIEARADNLLQPTSDGTTRIDVLQNAGLSGVYIGVESGSDMMLKLYAKGVDVTAMSEAVETCASRDVAVVATACYSDPDLLLRARYPLIDLKDPRYQMEIVKQRESILSETRAFMDTHKIPLNRQEEYAMVGIPVSTTYHLLERERHRYSSLVEHADPESRYLYPKGFRWWASKVYEVKRLVRPYIDFNYQPLEI